MPYNWHVYYMGKPHGATHSPCSYISKWLITGVGDPLQTFWGHVKLIVANGVTVEGYIMMAICHF